MPVHARQNPNSEPHPRSVLAFCRRQGICRSSFYNHPDKMPAVTRIGARVLITETAERDWERRNAGQQAA